MTLTLTTARPFFVAAVSILALLGYGAALSIALDRGFGRP